MMLSAWAVFRRGATVVWCGALLLFFSCSPPESPPNRALYEWRSAFEIDEGAYSSFDSLGVTRLYVRFFDVQWDDASGAAVPRSTARSVRPIDGKIEVVPTVYITNETMKRVPPERIDSLAVRIVEKIDAMAASIRTASSADGRSSRPTPSVSYREVQIDCDWTATSRTSYFALLTKIGEILPPEVTLSATIRLHQVKYRVETGTPPVDRGLLMAYNTGEVTEPDEENSIIDYDVVEDYLGELDEYPLPLDVALPIFAWGVRFHFDRFASILPEVTAAELARRAEFRQVAPNRFVVLRKTDLRDQQLEPGDVIRTEEARPEEVLPIADLIADELRSEPRTIVLYRYDPQIFARHETNRLLPLYRAFD